MFDAALKSVSARAFTIPTDAPEADGTFAWNSTTLVLAEVKAGGKTGVGYSYTDAAAAAVINGAIAGAVVDLNALEIPLAHEVMLRRIRNIGRSGLVATAIAAVDAALWDLKGKLLDVPVVSLLGAAREAVPVYGSGGFTSYPIGRLEEQLGSWASQGMRWVKMKVGSDPSIDLDRVKAARNAIGSAELFVDANGAYDRKQALSFAEDFASVGVVYFEEPVSSDDLEGLRLVRDKAPDGMKIAAGEYGYDIYYFRRMLEAGATDVQQVGRHALPRPDRVPASRCALHRLLAAAFGALCARSASACGSRCPLALEPGVVPRPRPHRAHAVRRRSRPEGRRHPRRPRPPWSRPRIQAPRRAAIRRVS